MNTKIKVSKHKDPARVKLFNTIFDFEEINEPSKPKEKIIVKYNETVYFTPKDGINNHHLNHIENAKNTDDYLSQVVSNVKNIQAPQPQTAKQAILRQRPKPFSSRNPDINNQIITQKSECIVTESNDDILPKIKEANINLRDNNKSYLADKSPLKKPSQVFAQDFYSLKDFISPRAKGKTFFNQTINAKRNNNNNNNNISKDNNNFERTLKNPISNYQSQPLFNLRRGQNSPPNNNRSNYLSLNNNKSQGLNSFKKNKDATIILSIVCINCGNSFPAEDIDKHSLVCTKVSEELLKTEKSNYEVYPINFKLNKLAEHVASLNKNNVNLPPSLDNEIKCISTVLHQYLKDTLSIEKINANSIQTLKKTLQNIDHLAKPNFNMSSHVLIDRAKVLVSEKLKIFKEFYKIQISTQKANENKTGTLQYEEVIKEKRKELAKINLEAELEKNKVKNLRKSATPLTKPNNLRLIVEQANKRKNEKLLNSDMKVPLGKRKSEDNLNKLNISANSDEINSMEMKGNLDEKSTNMNEEEGKQNEIEYHEQKIGEVISDVENNSQCVSNNTSFSNASFSREEEFGEGFGLRNGYQNNKNSSQSTNTNFLGINKQGDVNLNFGTYNSDIRMNKQQFYNIVLKTKFEKLNGIHPGQKIHPNAIYKECVKYQVPREKWEDFIFAELNNPGKYNAVKRKTHLGGSPMGVIVEEK